MKKVKVKIIGPAKDNPDSSKEYVCTAYGVTDKVVPGDIIEVSELSFRRFKDGYMYDDKAKMLGVGEKFYWEVEGVVDDIDLTKYDTGMYKIITTSKLTDQASIGKLYGYVSCGLNVGDIVQVDKFDLRKTKDGHRMLNARGTQCGTWKCASYAEIEPVQQVEQNKEKTMTLKEHYAAMQNECGIKVGDRVKILRKAKSSEMGWNQVWDPLMDREIGKEAKVTRICPYNGILAGHYYPFFVLEKLEKLPTTFNIGTYKVTITDNDLTFGCTTLSKAQIEELINMWNKHKTS
jgi:hypothetical protein